MQAQPRPACPPVDPFAKLYLLVAVMLTFRVPGERDLWWDCSPLPSSGGDLDLSRARCRQPSHYRLEDPTNATPPGRTLGAAAQPGNPVSASGAAGRARAVVEGAITSALQPRPPLKNDHPVPTL
jgi:hypothetical protein